MITKEGKIQRREAIEKMRDGTEKILYATYSLAKEGLDIPILDTLIMATPKKDMSVIIQSVGRIERTCKDKNEPIVYDVLDDDITGEFNYFENLYAARKRVYKKNNNKVENIEQ